MAESPNGPSIGQARKFNRSLDELKFLYFKVQRGKCMICGKAETYPDAEKPYRLSMDHDHGCCPPVGGNSSSCRRCVRFFLCNGCNKKLGAVEAWTREPEPAEALYLRMCHLIREGYMPHPMSTLSGEQLTPQSSKG
jgi:hypothetical protein